MTLSGPETAGIIIVIIVILLLCLGAFYSTKHVRQQNTLPDATDPPLPTDSGRPSLTSLLRLKGTNKRTEISDPEHHIRYPSLEHGPGPTLTTLAVPETPAIGTIRAVTATPTASPSSTRVEPADSVASNDRSSLHQAVLDVGTEDDQQNGDASKKPDDVASTAKEWKHSLVSKAYTGAWPLRDVHGASERR